MVIAGSTLSAQTIEIGMSGIAAADRGDAGTGVVASDGIGFGGWVQGRRGRFTGEARGSVAWLSGPDGRDWRDAKQLTMRGRYRLLPVVALELSVVRRTFAPDPEGTGLGFVSAGVRSDFSIAGRGALWGRVAYVPSAAFSGGGSTSLGWDVGLGFALDVIGGRLQVVGRYDFQRIDRRVQGTQPPPIESRSSIEFDVLELGVSLAFGRRTGGSAPTPVGSP
jgi:hypothetical protein